MMLKQVKQGEYMVTLPMSDKSVYGMNVDDLGVCVRNIFDHPDEYKSKIVGVAGDYLKGTEVTNILNKQLAPNKFVYANLSLDAFRGFGFPGAEELGNMFEYFQLEKMPRDIKLAKKLNPATLSFSDWLNKNKQDILKKLPQA